MSVEPQLNCTTRDIVEIKICFWQKSDFSRHE